MLSQRQFFFSRPAKSQYQRNSTLSPQIQQKAIHQDKVFPLILLSPALYWTPPSSPSCCRSHVARRSRQRWTGASPRTGQGPELPKEIINVPVFLFLRAYVLRMSGLLSLRVSFLEMASHCAHSLSSAGLKVREPDPCIWKAERFLKRSFLQQLS